MLKFTLADRYIGVQLLATIGFSLVLFVIIWLAPETMMNLSQAVADGKLTLAQGFTALMLEIPEVLLTAIPMAALLGTVFVVRKLCQQSELVAMLGAGLSPQRLFLPLFLVSIVFAGLYAMVQEGWAPQAYSAKQALLSQSGLKNSKPEPFVYLERNSEQKQAHSQGHPKQFFVAGTIAATTQPTEPPRALTSPQSQSLLKPAKTALTAMQIVLLRYGSPKADVNTPEQGTPIREIIQAEQAVPHVSGTQWQLHQGIRYALDEDGVYQSAKPFSTLNITLPKALTPLAAYHQQNPMHLSTSQLMGYTQLLAETGQLQDRRFFDTRLLQKLFSLLTPVIFVLLGALIGLEPPRSWRATALTVAAVVLFMYGVSLPFSLNLGSLGLIPIQLAAALPQLIAAGITLVSLQLLGNAKGYLGKVWI
ncbi:MAG: LptF/LptG family permease [Vampirovibrionales bacterium]|nr:LptF/LptG family permease [Vampirovibrionales bacterium]